MPLYLSFHTTSTPFPPSSCTIWLSIHFLCIIQYTTFFSQMMQATLLSSHKWSFKHIKKKTFLCTIYTAEDEHKAQQQCKPGSMHRAMRVSQCSVKVMLQLFSLEVGKVIVALITSYHLAVSLTWPWFIMKQGSIYLSNTVQHILISNKMEVNDSHTLFSDRNFISPRSFNNSPVFFFFPAMKQTGSLCIEKSSWYFFFFLTHYLFISNILV